MGLFKFNKEKFNDGINEGIGNAVVSIFMAIIIMPLFVVPAAEAISEWRAKRKEKQNAEKKEE